MKIGKHTRTNAIYPKEITVNEIILKLRRNNNFKDQRKFLFENCFFSNTERYIILIGEFQKETLCSRGTFLTYESVNPRGIKHSLKVST